MKRRTKIVCTLGPAVDSREKIKALIDAGMNVARLNCSHGNWEQKRQWVEWVRELSDDLAPVAILADLQGPKFRIGEIPDGQRLIPTGQTVTVGLDDADIPINQPEILEAICANCRLLLGDGEIELKVTAGRDGRFTAKVANGGMLKSRKGVTLVNKVFETPAMTEKDRTDIVEAVQLGCDFIALSYVKDAADMRELRRVVEKLDPTIGLCAKIETREAIKDLDEILKVADIVMVARGDMGLQMDLEEVPVMQKRIIDECTWAGKPVITATQMLESMIYLPRPTRAETTDVFNAILDGTDAVMLSGETAAGAYPVECVRTMVKIAERAESVYDRSKIDLAFQERSRKQVSHTDAIAHAVSELAHLLDPRAILCTSTSGQTPRLVSKFRPRQPILCATWNKRTQARMAVVWGVEALHIEQPGTTDDVVQRAIDAFFEKKRLKLGDHVILTAGVPAGTPGNTNLILTETVR
jgi:pyruvate kinase